MNCIDSDLCNDHRHTYLDRSQDVMWDVVAVQSHITQGGVCFKHVQQRSTTDGAKIIAAQVCAIAQLTCVEEREG